MAIKYRQTSVGPLAEIDDVREDLPEIAKVLDTFASAVAEARETNAIAKATGGPCFLTINGPGFRVTITNGHAG